MYQIHRDYSILEVTSTEQFTNHFMNDLKKLAYFQVNL
jgi:hypothetical protein